MKILSRSTPALLGCLVLSANSHAEGFVDDAKASLNLRNFYINRNFVDGNNPQA